MGFMRHRGRERKNHRTHHIPYNLALEYFITYLNHKVKKCHVTNYTAEKHLTHPLLLHLIRRELHYALVVPPATQSSWFFQRFE